MPRRLPPILSVLTGLALVLAACSTGTASPAATDEATDAPAATVPTATPAAASPTTTPAPTEPTADACLPSTETGTVAVQIQGFAFAPGRVQAKVGEVITFTNSDGAPHTATLNAGSCTTPTLGKDASGSLVFTAAGEYPFHCRIHPDMTGTFEISG